MPEGRWKAREFLKTAKNGGNVPKGHGKMFENFETGFFDEKNVCHVGNNEENPLENTSTRNTTVGSLRILVQKWWAHILVSS